MSPTNETRARLVALGASNLTRGCGCLVECARRQAGGPVEVLAALGHGRSFGANSRVLGRTLPGIDGCGLWDALAAAPPLPATGVVMDVGNDLLYGFDVPVVLGWVERALARLRPRVDRLVVAGLPMESLRRLGPVRYTLVRSLLFPRCRIGLPAILGMAEQLDAGLASLARRHDAVFLRLPRRGYGRFDPIHLRRRAWPEASRELLAAAGCTARGSATGLAGWLRLVRARPALRWRFGHEQHQSQPAVRWPDGSVLSLW